MANYHSHIGVVSRGQGDILAQKVVYITGETIRDEYCGKMRSYERSDVVYCTIILPADAPIRFRNLQALTNEMDQAEKHCDAQTARHIHFALPVELSTDDQITLACRAVTEFWVNQGMCAILAIHDAGQGNPHAHLLLTLREVTHNGFCAKKQRKWNNKALYCAWRKFWADEQNREFAQRGLDVCVSHESYFVQGIDKKANALPWPRSN